MIFPEIDGDLSLDEMSCILPIYGIINYFRYIMDITTHD
jgi:hypothetical protein